MKKKYMYANAADKEGIITNKYNENKTGLTFTH
jgi:hypothetical protein